MIHVIASVEVMPGKKDELLGVFKKNVANVRAEKGCIAYAATVDLASGIPIQPPVRPNVVTIVETWENLDALKAHLATPHMAEYFKATRGLVKGTSLQVLQPA